MPKATGFASSMKKRTDDAPAPKSALEEARQEDSATKAPSRAGKTPVTAFVAKPVLRQLKLLTVELEMSQQDIIIAALSDYFEKNEKQPIQR